MKTQLTLSTIAGGSELITITAKLAAKGVPFPNEVEKKGALHNCFIITFKTTEGKASIKFYDSQKAFTNGIIELDESSLRDTLDCFLSDAIAGKVAFEDFCDEFGYDTDSRTAKRIHKACESITKKAERIFIGDLYDLSNALSEVENAS